MALARLRQLSAHEVGHTIGMGHNYYDSSQGRISVLDYPHPLVTLRPDGTLDLSEAYENEIGEWDKVAVTWAYQDFPPGTDEDAALDRMIETAWAQDLRYMTNQDTDVHPRVDQWANGTDAAAELLRMLQVRRAALNRFGETAIRKNVPMAAMEEVLVPLYLHHRYQVEATASALGGLNYIYALRGDGREPVDPVPAKEQMAALDALLRTLSPAELALPRAVLDRLPPRPSGYPRSRELFPRFTGQAFDPISPALVAADHTITTILQPERAARLVAQKAVDSSLPHLADVINRMTTAIFDVKSSSPYEAEIGRAVRFALVERLMELAGRAPMPQVRAAANQTLVSLQTRLQNERGDSPDAADALLIADDIKRFRDRPIEPIPAPATPDLPPGAPIGSLASDDCSHASPPRGFFRELRIENFELRR
jgi:hypothetical protein